MSSKGTLTRLPEELAAVTALTPSHLPQLIPIWCVMSLLIDVSIAPRVHRSGGEGFAFWGLFSLLSCQVSFLALGLATVRPITPLRLLGAALFILCGGVLLNVIQADAVPFPLVSFSMRNTAHLFAQFAGLFTIMFLASGLGLGWVYQPANAPAEYRLPQRSVISDWASAVAIAIVIGVVVAAVTFLPQHDTRLWPWRWSLQLVLSGVVLLLTFFMFLRSAGWGSVVLIACLFIAWSIALPPLGQWQGTGPRNYKDGISSGVGCFAWTLLTLAFIRTQGYHLRWFRNERKPTTAILLDRH